MARIQRIRQTRTPPKSMARTRTHDKPIPRKRKEKTRRTKMNQKTKNNIDFIVPQNQLIDHIIQIDNNTEVHLKIPYKLDSIELEGTILKLKKLVNVSTIDFTQERKTRRVYHWTPEQDEQVIKLYKEGKTIIQISEQLQIEYGRVSTRVEKFRKNGRLPPLKKIR